MNLAVEETTRSHSHTKTTAKSSNATPTRFVALRGKIAPHCVPNDKVLLSVYAHFVVLGLVINKSKSAQRVWLPRDQWYKRYEIHEDSIKFAPSLRPLP